MAMSLRNLLVIPILLLHIMLTLEMYESMTTYAVMLAVLVLEIRTFEFSLHISDISDFHITY